MQYKDAFKIGDYQTGFKEGFSIHIYVTRVLWKVRHACAYKKYRVGMVLIDVKRAYDSVDHEISFRMLMEWCKD